ncbi:MBL fold metallo-hydrolase [Rubellimicrobium aerolatum]|uniref:MBL fold metallo-hydrolase n=1 Tax=Rubellimicrobium aerolatum TaxID=490979 RepID=A0ABW0SB39_9RHOB|nr:MBL fold metallo-hydrolase [Rubellimicrobium aerolatum]MBP1805408.1 glyoxylase-like metal-dependent hydrolase (beta-lactamase superfamily II) [Rubellimicrobium aerolatum]
MRLSRRHALIAGAVLPLAAPALLRARPALAQDAPAAAPTPLSRSFTLGEMKVTALLAGTGAQENPHEIFGLNVDQATFERESAENFIPADRSVGFFTPTLVDTGRERILFDTGMMAAGLLAAMGHAGYAPADVTHVVLTHHHPDHIGGLTDDAGSPTFPEAAYLTGQAEFDHWAAQGNEGFEAKVRPFAERMTFLAPDQEAAPGVTAVEAFGHTPGHLAFRLESGGQGLLLTADTANHYVWSLANPDWEVLYDADKAQAAATRRRLLGMLAAERMPMLGYHMPFPAVGFVEPDGDGFRWVPHSYQLS